MRKAVVFDMDGTVLDTSADLTNALNYAMHSAGLKDDYTPEEVKSFFGSGMEMAVLRALSGQKMTGEQLQEKKKEVCGVFAQYYPQHSNEKTAPYTGIEQVLGKLRKNGIGTAVASNKMDQAVQILVKDLFPGMFDFAVGEQPGIRRKPAPDMVKNALQVLHVSEENAIYIGDSEVDMKTAENAGLPCISVTWGFRSEKFLQEHGAKHIVHDTGELYTEAEALLSL